MRILAFGVFVIALSVASPAGAELTALERQRLLAHLEMTSAWLSDEVAGLSDQQLNFKPSPGAWSIRQVLEHLVIVGPIYWEDLQKALKSPADGRRSISTDADMLWYGIDRTARETAIPSEDVKGSVRDLAAALAAYRRNHARLVEYIKTTKDDLRRHIVDRQGCDAYQWALLITTHEQRHILQIREVKRHPAFR